MTGIEIGPAQPYEIDAVLAVLDEAAAWLHSLGITEQWPLSMSRRAGAWEQTMRDVEQGAVIVARTGGEVAGVFRLDDSDDLVWPGAAPEDGLYLHSLAVRRAVAGTGLAARMLTWARIAAAARGRLELRLDCWAGNERLRRYYLEQGFSFRGESRIEGDGERTAYSVARFAIRPGPGN